MIDGDWSVLDLPADPVRGDPSDIQALASFAEQEAEYWGEHAASLRAVANQGSSMPMEGDYAAVYRDHLTAIPPRADELQSAHSTASGALSQFLAEFEQAKSQSQAALTAGMQAKEQYNSAMQAYDQIVAEMNSLPKVVPPEQYPYVMEQWEQLQMQATQAQEYAQQAQENWEMARQNAVAAGETASEAEAMCAQSIQSAAPGASTSSGGSGGGAAVGVGSSGAAPFLRSGSSAERPTTVPSPLTGDRLSTGAELGGKYRGENDPTNDDREFYPSTVKYLSESEREQYRVFADKDGLLRWAKDGTLFDTAGATVARAMVGPPHPRAIFVMDKSGNLYASMSQKAGEFHHSSFLGGANVVGAGELEARNGRLFALTDQSGHYEPSAEQNDFVIESLSERGVQFRPDFKAYGWGGVERTTSWTP